MMLLPMNISCKFVSHSPPQIVIICLRQKSNRQVHRKLRCIYILICAYDFTWIMGKHIACVGYIFTYWVILMISSIFLNSEMVITRITKFDLIFSLWHFFFASLCKMTSSKASHTNFLSRNASWQIFCLRKVICGHWRRNSMNFSQLWTFKTKFVKIYRRTAPWSSWLKKRWHR